MHQDMKYYYGGKKSYDNYDTFNDWAEEAQALQHLFSFESILDVGCGLGNLLYELKKQNPTLRTAGCEISRFAKQENKAESVQLGNFLDLEFASKFDVVLFYSSLTYFPVDEVPKALKKAFDLCKKAVVIFDVYGSKDSDLPASDRDIYRKVYFTKKQWLALLKTNFPRNEIISDTRDEEREFLVLLRSNKKILMGSI